MRGAELYGSEGSGGAVLAASEQPEREGPQMPQMQCTGTAPIGSSMRSYSSSSTPPTTTTTGDRRRAGWHPVGLTQ